MASLLLADFESSFRTYTTLQIRATIARRIVELATAVRLFVKCEKRERALTDINYRCESGAYPIKTVSLYLQWQLMSSPSDAIWPLIGHVKWYCDFCKDLVMEARMISTGKSHLPTLPG